MAHVLVLGSSSSEVFDYIFGPRPDYSPFWASGWSARGLLREDAGGYVATMTRDVPRDALVLLNFGATDVVFNARHKAINGGLYDFAGFLDQALAGILHLRGLLQGLGFDRITAVFPSPVVRLGPQQLARLGLAGQLPALMLARMYADLARRTCAAMPGVDLTPVLARSADEPWLHPRFRRDGTDTHPDYIRTQEIVWDAIAGLDGMIARRDTWLTQHYPHTQITLPQLRPAGLPRPNTCQ